MTQPSLHTPASSPASLPGSPPGVDWHHDRGILHVRCAPDTGQPDEHDDVLTRIEVETDNRDRVTDVVIKDLPASVVRRLAGYTRAPVDESSPVAGVSVDPDAGRLWLHLREGRHGRRPDSRGHVRLSFGHGQLTGVEVQLPDRGAAEAPHEPP
ncbi:hypothetical protein ACYF6T_19605 [Streptomyces sp. 7R007]